MAWIPTALSLAPTVMNAISGGAANAGMAGLNSQSEIFQLGMYAQQLHHQEQMQTQSEAFDEMMDEKSEIDSTLSAWRWIGTMEAVLAQAQKDAGAQSAGAVGPNSLLPSTTRASN